MIHLTAIDSTPVDISKAEIREVEPLGDGAIIFQNAGPPIRVIQGMPWIMALWKAR